MEPILTHPSCKDPGVLVVRRIDLIAKANSLLDPRYQLDMHSLSKCLEIYSAANSRKRLTINAPSRTKYVLASVADELIQFIIGRQSEIPRWRARAVARSKRSAAAFKSASRASSLEPEDTELPPVVSTEAAMEVNRIIDGRPSKLAALYAEAIMKAPNSHPVLRLGADNYVALYESPRM